MGKCYDVENSLMLMHVLLFVKLMVTRKDKRGCNCLLEMVQILATFSPVTSVDRTLQMLSSDIRDNNQQTITNVKKLGMLNDNLQQVSTLP